MTFSTGDQIIYAVIACFAAGIVWLFWRMLNDRRRPNGDDHEHNGH